MRPEDGFQFKIRVEAVILSTVSSDPGFHGDVLAALGGRIRFETAWELGFEDAARLYGIKSDQKCLAIVDFIDPTRALPLARMVSGRLQIVTIAVGCGDTRDDLMTMMQAGVRDVLPHLSARDLFQAVNRALAVLGSAGEILADLYAFVPAKPGCGATTVATHAAGLASRLAEEPTLLLDFDVRLGVTTFLLQTGGTHTILDALQNVERLDPDMWSGLVSEIGSLHVLGSGAGDFSHPYSAEHFMELLDFAVRQYSVVAVDLPGTMEDYECDVLLRSKSILLVCTPDIGALHVARRKSQWFQDLRLTDKVSVVLNCMDRRSAFSVEDIERLLQLPVRYMLPASAKDVLKAVQKGEILSRDGSLGRQIAAIAADMRPARAGVKKPSPIRRFVEYFSVSPIRTAGGA